MNGVQVRVPATSANLGPGFDALGLALAWYDEVEARVTDGGLTVAVTGEGAAEVDRGEGHLVVRAMRAAFTRLGSQPPGLALRCRNSIPHARGLGSSAAAIVAGVLAARALVDKGEEILSDPEAFALATEIEGHPDNVAACMAGGLTVAWLGPDGAGGQTPRMLRLTPVAGVRPVVCVPPDPVPTEEARRLLPAEVPHADAARNAGRAALLVAALITSEVAERSQVLLDATEDRLHQDYRAAAMPATARLVRELRAVGVPAVVSGAGPAVLAFGSPQIVDSTARKVGNPWHTRPLNIDRVGAFVRRIGPTT